MRALAATGLKTFVALITRWEQNNEPPPVAAAKEGAAASVATSKYATFQYGLYNILTELTPYVVQEYDSRRRKLDSYGYGRGKLLRWLR